MCAAQVASTAVLEVEHARLAQKATATAAEVKLASAAMSATEVKLFGKWRLGLRKVFSLLKLRLSRLTHRLGFDVHQRMCCIGAGLVHEDISSAKDL